MSRTASYAAYEAADEAAYAACKAAEAADESQAGYAEDLVMQIERQAAVIESLRAALDAADLLVVDAERRIQPNTDSSEALLNVRVAQGIAAYRCARAKAGEGE